MSVDDEQCFGWLLTVTMTENVAKVREAILEDWQRVIHDVWNIVGLLYGMCQQTLSDELNMRCTAVKFVPRLLSSDQKEYHISVCTEFKEQAEKTLTLSPTSLLVTNLGCLGMMLRLSSSRLIGRLQLHRDRRNHNMFRTISIQCWIFFWESEGIMHKEFVPTGQMVNGKLYCDVLRWMREIIQTSGAKTPGSCIMTKLCLTHCTLCGSSWVLWIQVIPHPPYSLDLAPCDFFLLLKMKLKLKGRLLTALER
jgi:histone-lysine N-methyltransferase SETMAR